MEFPFWSAPLVGSGWFLTITTIFYVLTTLSALGGGIFLAVSESGKLYDKSEAFRLSLHKHSWFFLVLISVFGVLSYFAMWMAYILTSPMALSTIVNTFAWMWLFQAFAYLLEIGTAYVIYATFGKMKKQEHTSLTWIFVFLAFISLLVGNMSLSFQLTPGNWEFTQNFEHAVFNAHQLPTLLLRISFSIVLAGIYALITFSKIETDDKKEILDYVSYFILIPFIVIPLFGIWYYFTLDPVAVENFANGLTGYEAGNLGILTRVLFFTVFAAVMLILLTFVGPILNAKGFEPSSAWFILFAAFLTAGSFEYTRSLIAKPYTIFGYEYTNSLVKGQEQKYMSGFLSESKWTHIKSVTEDNKLAAGFELFKYQCNSCHVQQGINSIVVLTKEQDADALKNTLKFMTYGNEDVNPYIRYMPPFVGTDKEAEALATYLAYLNGTYEPSEKQVEILEVLQTQPSLLENTGMKMSSVSVK